MGVFLGLTLGDIGILSWTSQDPAMSAVFPGLNSHGFICIRSGSVKNQDHSIWSHHFVSNRRGKSGNSDNFIFLGSKTTVDGKCSHKIKRRLLLGRKATTNLDSLSETFETSKETKQRHHFAGKGPSSQGYGFASRHVWMLRAGL